MGNWCAKCDEAETELIYKHDTNENKQKVNEVQGTRRIETKPKGEEVKMVVPSHTRKENKEITIYQKLDRQTSTKNNSIEWKQPLDSNRKRWESNLHFDACRMKNLFVGQTSCNSVSKKPPRKPHVSNEKQGKARHVETKSKKEEVKKRFIPRKGENNDSGEQNSDRQTIATDNSLREEKNKRVPAQRRHVVVPKSLFNEQIPCDLSQLQNSRTPAAVLKAIRRNMQLRAEIMERKRSNIV